MAHKKAGGSVRMAEIPNPKDLELKGLVVSL